MPLVDRNRMRSALVLVTVLVIGCGDDYVTPSLCDGVIGFSEDANIFDPIPPVLVGGSLRLYPQCGPEDSNHTESLNPAYDADTDDPTIITATKEPGAFMIDLVGLKVGTTKLHLYGVGLDTRFDMSAVASASR